MEVAHFTDGNFDQEVLQSVTPVFVDFWAAWCGPCRMVGPVIEDLAGDYLGRVKFGKLDVDANPSKAAQFGVRSIPTMIVFREGRVIETIVGALPKAAIAAKIDAALAR